MKQRLLTILWPAFVMAGVLEILVFAMVDPGDLHGFGGPATACPERAIYSLAFLVFWAVIGATSALTLWLALPQAREDEGGTSP